METVQKSSERAAGLHFCDITRGQHWTPIPSTHTRLIRRDLDCLALLIPHEPAGKSCAVIKRTFARVLAMVTDTQVRHQRCQMAR